MSVLTWGPSAWGLCRAEVSEAGEAAAGPGLRVLGACGQAAAPQGWKVCLCRRPEPPLGLAQAPHPSSAVSSTSVLSHVPGVPAATRYLAVPASTPGHTLLPTGQNAQPALG